MDKKTNKLPVIKILENTEALAIWNEIKDKNIDMFALPDQKINKYCEPAVVEPTKLYLKVSVSSVLPALETAIGNNYVVEMVDKYVSVARAVKK